MIDKRLHESAIKIHFKSRKDQTHNPGARYLLASTDWVQVTQEVCPHFPSVRLPDEEFSPKLVLPAARLLNLRRTWSSVKSTHGIVHFPYSLKIMPNLFTDVTFSTTTKTVCHHLVPQMYSRKQNCLQVKKHFFAWNKFNNYFSSYDEKYDGQALKLTWENLSEEIFDICFYVVFKWNFEASWTADDQSQRKNCMYCDSD